MITAINSEDCLVQETANNPVNWLDSYRLRILICRRNASWVQFRGTTPTSGTRSSRTTVPFVIWGSP